MSETTPTFTLTAAPFAGDVDVSFRGTRLTSATGIALTSIAVSREGRAALAAAAPAALPAPRETALSADGAVRLIALGADQFLAIAPAPLDDPALAAAACLADQTDTWIALRLAGPRAVVALERICPLDLHPSEFPPGRAARTVMEHLGVVIVRESVESFLLLGASSSARSFVRAVETSARNVS